MLASSRLLPLVATFAAAALVCCYGGFIAQGILNNAAPALAPSVLGTAVIGYLALSRSIAAKEDLGPRAAPATALIVVVAAPVFGVLADVALSLPLVAGPSHADPAFGEAMMRLLAVIVVSAPVVASGVERLARHGGPIAAAALRIAAPPAVVIAFALAALGAISPRPAPNRWLATLPVAVEIPAPRADGEEVFEAGPVDVVRRCGDLGRSCSVWLVRRGEAPAVHWGDLLVDGRLVLRRDAAHDLWVLDGAPGREKIFVDDNVVDRAAYRGPALTRELVRPQHVAGALGPPRGWIIAGAIGAGIAAAGLARRRRARRALEEILAAEAGTADEGGWITLDRGGAPLRHAGPITPGPVLVVMPRATAAGAYRSEGARSADRVLVGTRDELAGQARRVIAAIDARALATALIAAAPLAVAWAEGIR